MKPDTRGFDYAFEPLLLQQRWRLAALQVELAAADEQLREAAVALQRQQAELDQAHAHAAQGGAATLDPVVRTRQLRWLAAARSALTVADADLQALRASRQSCAERLLAGASKLRALEQHRDDAQGEHLQLVERRKAAAADAEWLARSGSVRVAQDGAR